MKQLIFREGILLAVPSIPLGLLFGFLIAKVSFNWLVEQGNLVSSGIKNHQVPLFSLTIMLICIFVSFLTVVLALRKPMKIVSRISPIEATRYLGGSKTQNRADEKAEKMSPFLHGNGKCDRQSEKNHCYDSYHGAFLCIVCNYL